MKAKDLRVPTTTPSSGRLTCTTSCQVTVLVVARLQCLSLAALLVSSSSDKNSISQTDSIPVFHCQKRNSLASLCVESKWLCHFRCQRCVFECCLFLYLNLKTNFYMTILACFSLINSCNHITTRSSCRQSVILSIFSFKRNFYFSINGIQIVFAPKWNPMYIPRHPKYHLE